MNLVVDVNLIVNADAGVLSKSLDSVCDLTTKSFALQLWGDIDVEHDSSRTLGLADQVLVVLYLLSEGFLNFQHSRYDFVSIDIDASVCQVALDLITG